jgi:two-component system repressor protein LuxO
MAERENDGPTVEKSMLPTPIASGHLNAEEEPNPVGHTTTTNVSSSQDHMAPHIVKRQQVIPLWLIEKNTIEGAIEACGGNVNQAAGLLEVAPSTIYRKLQSWKKVSA